MEDYFNSLDYEHPILKGNNVRVENISLDRKETKLTVVGSNLFGNVFFLDIEFVDMLNSFSFFKNGEIKNFIRKRDENGDEIMSTSIKLQMQQPSEKDEDDEKFEEYTKWRLGRINRPLSSEIEDSTSPTSPIVPGPSARPRVAPTAPTSEVKIKDNEALREERDKQSESVEVPLAPSETKNTNS